MEQLGRLVGPDVLWAVAIPSPTESIYRMPSPTFSITWVPRLLQALDARRYSQRMRGSRSAAVAEIVARYEEMATRCRPKLSESEWAYMEDLFEKTQFDAVTIDGLAAMVRRPFRLGDRLQRWGIDTEALGKKLDRLDYAGRLAVVDHLEMESTRRTQAKNNIGGSPTSRVP